MITTISTDDLVDAAMCLWEYCLNESPRQFSDYVVVAGYCETRSRIAALAALCHQAYEVAREQGYDNCFDWEFVPRWFDRCVEEDLTVNCTPAEAAGRVLEDN